MIEILKLQTPSFLWEFYIWYHKMLKFFLDSFKACDNINHNVVCLEQRIPDLMKDMQQTIASQD